MRVGHGEAIQPGVFGASCSIGSLTELALTNASAHQLVEAQALTDPLTKLANRRETRASVRASRIACRSRSSRPIWTTSRASTIASATRQATR